MIMRRDLLKRKKGPSITYSHSDRVSMIPCSRESRKELPIEDAQNELASVTTITNHRQDIPHEFRRQHLTQY